jgi:hypothetical protein
MDTLNQYRCLLERILEEYTVIPYAHSDLHCDALFDRERDRYALITHGWDGQRHVHYTLVHVEIRNGKIWIHQDGTEDGIATELMAAGVPKEDIVLAFHPPELRQYTEFAVA